MAPDMTVTVRHDGDGRFGSARLACWRSHHRQALVLLFVIV